MEPLYENGTRNFFIDEITAVTDFQKYGNVLSDYFSAKGAKVIIAGTDSLGIMLAESDILYDRIQMIHTSHVPYAEFSRLLGGKTLDDYIEYGGTLTKSPYKTLQASEEYQNTAIVGNILHSLEKSEDARRYGAALTELYDHDELQSVLNKMINKFSYFVTVQAVNKYFKSAPDNEEESRAYFDQLWAEAMVIFNSCKGFPGIAENDSCIWNVIEFIFITIHIKFPTANGHEVDFGIRSF